jgi:hypothetical protein
VVKLAARALPSEPTPLRETAPKEAEPVVKTGPHPQGNSTPTVSKVLRAASTGTLKTAVKVVLALASAAVAVTEVKVRDLVGTSNPDKTSST